ncbi:TlpA family protein disulfide reductase [Ureibacillus sp. MALMAid1270]|uniref:TlpA family protein disulfide reductase n=1 Tax=Ureibacillus sp. MALMAid1270 TaxID=3411629 RepID=UPI003BA804AF
MRKNWLSYSILVVIVCVIVWTIYSNLFQSKLTIDKSMPIGSYDIELAEPDETEIDEGDESEEVVSDKHEEAEHDHEDSILDTHSENENHDHSHDINTTEVVDVSNPAPQFVTKTLDGKQVQLSDYLGKKVILNFWTTWCPPCQEEVPELQKFYETSASQHDVVLLGLNITYDDLGIDVIHDFREYYGITYPILLDETREITDSYEILTIPTTYIIDENGNLEKQIIGPLTSEMLDEILED